VIYDFNKNKYHVPGSEKKYKSGSSLSNNRSKSSTSKKFLTGNLPDVPLGEFEDSRSTKLPQQIETPTEIAAAVVALAAIPIGEIIILFSLVGLALTVTWKDEKTGKEYTIGSYTLEQIVNAGNFVAQVSVDIYNAVGDKIAKAGMTLEKFTKIVDENLGKIPGFPGTSDQVIIPNDTGHTENETREIPQGTPGFDTTSGQTTQEHLDTGHTQRHDDLEDPVMRSESENEQEQLPPIVDVNPARLVSRQVPSEMSNSKVQRLRKKIRKNGFDRSQPIPVADVDGELIIIDGHHRAQAAARERLTSVPVRIYKVSPEKELEYKIQAAEAAEYRRYDQY
jgi:hypothetical protein